MTIRLAFSGTGYISKIHAQAAQKIAGLQMTAVVNHRAESRRAFAEQFDIPHQYETIEELVQAGTADAVSINTPNYLHAPQSIAAIDAGLHVMVEKPMAMNAAEGAAMIAAAEKSDALLMVAHCWRFDEEVLWLKENIGRIGPVIRTKGYGVHSNWGPGGWFTQAQFAGGGALADMGIHALDTVRFLLDDPQPISVYAHIGTYYGDFDVDDTGVIIVHWDNGVVSYIESGWWQPHMDGPEAATQLYGKKGFGELFPTHLALPDPQTESIAAVDPGFPHPRPEHCPQIMYDNQLAEFIDCIRQGRAPNPGGAEGLVNMKIVDAAYASARSKQVVTIAKGYA
ncbi:MAG: Gfo/Idh/MocA family oxidoreductase [Candidatus Promineifilaceae bacterium]|nr:Gfo/Idh/MocA family oxidoreductase [Candidatus Promineifilaceae bacterium]